MTLGLVNTYSTHYISFMPGPTATYTDRFQMLLDPELRADLERFAEQKHMKRGQVVRTALREYLAKHMESERAA